MGFYALRRQGRPVADDYTTFCDLIADYAVSNSLDDDTDGEGDETDPTAPGSSS
ncbi:hypothetical protein G7085_12825 [Tessaracoccus sp. HDW20]|uniref:hypothetical protein n=1 Tax=Tessaracoccus coleopterorum TaxID=2714950 RepID=UPI0018D4A0F4|nr:hypothetical protein [Tessaracoccus coleopterorum]NHB85209.1 hypothetical protein [Tessaracoccus coleopterorum]